MASPSSLCLQYHYSAYSKQCFTMCNAGNWVAVNKGVRRPLVSFGWTEGPRGVPWGGRALSFSAEGGRKSQFPQANRWSEWNQPAYWCFSGLKRLSIFSFLWLLFWFVCVCVNAKAPYTSTAQLERKWTSPSNERWQAVDVTLLAWKRSFAFALEHLRGFPR